MKSSLRQTAAGLGAEAVGEPRTGPSDVMSSAKRSELMGRIRGRDTGPERVVRKLLRALCYRFRLHGRDLPGRPDIVFPRRRVALFVHGCFWHRHDCGLAYTPKTRSMFWQQKFEGNVARDRRVTRELKSAGWRVIVVWECQLDRLPALARRLTRVLGPPDHALTDCVIPSAGGQKARQKVIKKSPRVPPPRAGTSA